MGNVLSLELFQKLYWSLVPFQRFVVTIKSCSRGLEDDTHRAVPEHFKNKFAAADALQIQCQNLRPFHSQAKIYF